eukprot:1576368-Amphidinium_carterae.1
MSHCATPWPMCGEELNHTKKVKAGILALLSKNADQEYCGRSKTFKSDPQMYGTWGSAPPALSFEPRVRLCPEWKPHPLQEAFCAKRGRRLCCHAIVSRMPLQSRLL